ncbi:MAG: DUF402 domain-containing protein [Nocardioidaceae bacterium]|nr:DUF402 domain-containing protein [Nocardioidaceae bacterium]
MPAGTVQTKPSHSYASRTDATMLFADGVPATPSFRRVEGAPSSRRYRAYVDMTTPPVWDGDTVAMVDLDLDVVVTTDGEVRVLDEDELAAHRVLYDYPDDVVALAEQSCADVVEAFRTGREPYASVGWSWLP